MDIRGNKEMDFYRAKEQDLKLLKYKESSYHNTAFVASDDQKIIGAFEYDIKSMEAAEVVNFSILEPLIQAALPARGEVPAIYTAPARDTQQSRRGIFSRASIGTTVLTLGLSRRCFLRFLPSELR